MVVVALAALVALVGASCKQLDPNNRAAVVPGVTNGSLPMAYLASTASGCVVYDESINSLNAMIAQAAKDGVTLRPISCYRDYAGQVAAREEWCAKGACQMAAVPGTSNHGWGKAIDFRDQSGELTFDSAGYAWLKTWAGLLRLDPPQGHGAGRAGARGLALGVDRRRRQDVPRRVLRHRQRPAGHASRAFRSATSSRSS